MKNWILNLANNVDSFDLIGYYKLMRFLGRSYITLVSTDGFNKESAKETIKSQCNEFSKILSVRYLFDIVDIKDSTNLEEGILDCLYTLLERNTQIATISKVINLNVTEEELLKDFTTDNILVRPPRTGLDKCLIVRLSPEIVFVNSLLKFYVLYKKNNFDRTQTLKYISLLRDNYIPQALEKYLKNNIGYNFRFGDDCNGINIGSSVNMIFFDKWNKPKNPVLIAPLYGGTRGIVFNLFNQQQEKDEYIEIAEMIFGIRFEDASPEKQLEFLSNRAFKYTMASDLEVIISKLQKTGLGINDILVDISCNRGYEQWTQYLMNRMYINIYDMTDIGEKAMRRYESTPIYKDSYIYFTNKIYFPRAEEAIAGFVRSQFSNYFYVCKNYLEKVEKIRVNEHMFTADNLYNLEIWTEKITLVDTMNYRDISLWVVNTYYDFVKDTKSIPRDRLKQMLIITNLFNLNTIWYLNLVKHLLDVTDIRLKSFDLSGKYVLELRESNGNTFDYESVAIGLFFPKVSGVVIRNKQFKDALEVDMFRRLIRFPIVNSLDIEVCADNMLLADTNTIVLVNPDTLGIYYLNKGTNLFDTRYKVHEEDCLLSLDDSGDIKVSTSREYTFKPQTNTALYVLERSNDNISLNSSTLNFKSHIFSQEEDEYW